MNKILPPLDLLTTWIVELDATFRIKTLRHPATGEIVMPFTIELPVGIPIVQAMGLAYSDSQSLTQRLSAGENIKSYTYSVDHELLGRRTYVLSASVAAGRGAKPKGYHCSISDVTESTNLASLDRQCHLEMSTMLDASPNFLVVKDLEGRYVRFNRAARKIIAQWCKIPAGRTPDDILPGDLAAEIEAEDAYVLETERAAEFEQQFLVNDRLRTYRTTKFPIFDSEGCIVGVGAAGVDITEHKDMESELGRLANYDVLTELPNRNLCQKRANEAVLLAQHTNSRVAVILLDIKDFRSLNSTLGQEAGDQLLVEVAWRLLRVVPASATVARLSADEFCILIPDFEAHDEIRRAMNRVHDLFRDPFTLDRSEIFVGVTTGAAVYPQDAEGFDQLLRKADMALQHAKQQGVAAMHFVPGLDHATEQRTRISHLLRRALERRELELVYQPIVDGTTGIVATLEALLRWHSPELGGVSPDVFIPIAEDTGLIQSIGAWVLKTACAEAVVWNRLRSRPVGVSVNVSPRQLLAIGFVDLVSETLSEMGLNPSLLKIEITETCLAQDRVTCQSVLSALAALGIILALDDFGTGYAALSYLQDFNFHILKIDQSFVRKIVPGEASAALTAGIIGMARNLGMKTVAEGVEHSEHMNILRFQGCDFLQGYYFSRPLPWRELACLEVPSMAA
jgi:diguanylate cyclase (GGDEF)-like protein/PAS domain S-box-containing protein